MDSFQPLLFFIVGIIFDEIALPVLTSVGTWIQSWCNYHSAIHQARVASIQHDVDELQKEESGSPRVIGFAGEEDE